LCISGGVLARDRSSLNHEVFSTPGANMNSSIDRAMHNNFSALHLGPLEGMERFSALVSEFKREVPGKLFMRDLLALTGCEISINRLGPRGVIPFLHRHRRHEEIYLFLGGEGEFMVDGHITPVSEGSVVAVQPSGVRSWRNTSFVKPLYYVVIQAVVHSIDATGTEDGEAVPGTPTWSDLVTR
jgi:mannose-6-phosphate isomerase-like protein (cupin superfamily)